MTRVKRPKICMPNGEDARDCYGTPDHIVLAAMEDDHVKFTVDAAASYENSKGEKFWDKEKNGLAQDWSVERVWCNPPYSDIAPWVEKAKEANLACLLLPVRTDRDWFAECTKWATFIDFYRGRIQFVPAHPKIRQTQNYEYSMLVWFYKDIKEGQGAVCRRRSAASGWLLP